MGYRSDWRIIFNTCGKQQHVWDTLQQYVASHTTDAAELLREMLSSAICHQDEDVLELADGSWKLQGWDDLTGILVNLFDGDNEIDIAWCRLGEDFDDTEVRHGGYTQIYVERSMNANWDPVPKTRMAGTSVHTLAVCQCDLHQIMRGDGHDEGCPER